ncbi:Lrp/AsnC family transcriptional regulator [Oceanisphaera sediminis]|uniref:Lrp/AsnC family transcriptional regulator n=1 Tax=Oceanisphaera sediminis TaxID=981381 RepID=A0ABP7EUG7_9GAMM
MDIFDRQILALLQHNASLPLKDLAEAVNLSVTPCWKRVKKLEQAGFIRGRVALLDADKLGLGLSVFVQIKTQRHDSQWLAQFADTVTAFEEVVEFYRMSGEWDYMLRVVVADIGAFDRFYKKLITGTEGLSDITSSFAMEQIKYTTALPLGESGKA